jgi:hypothetical protein
MASLGCDVVLGLLASLGLMASRGRVEVKRENLSDPRARGAPQGLFFREPPVTVEQSGQSPICETGPPRAVFGLPAQRLGGL